jgi:hypothetical protein
MLANPLGLLNRKNHSTFFGASQHAGMPDNSKHSLNFEADFLKVLANFV